MNKKKREYSTSGKTFNTEENKQLHPRHFIYLDRNRLFSYISQMSNGLPTVKSLLRSASESSTTTPDSYEKKESSETSTKATGELNVSILKGSGSEDNKEITEEKWNTDDGSFDTYNSLQILANLKIEHDNLYLALEKDLLKLNLIKDIDESNIKNYNTSSIIKISSYASFVDPELIEAITFNKTANFDEALKDNENPEGTLSTIKDVVKLFSNFNKNSIILNMKIGDDKISAPLNKEYLYTTIEQLRSIYINNPSSYLTLIGHITRKNENRINNGSMVEILNLDGVIKEITGSIEFTIEPLAIYT